MCGRLPYYSVYTTIVIQPLYCAASLNIAILVIPNITMNINSANTILYCTRWTETVAFYRDVLELSENFSNDWFVEFLLNENARLSIANEARASIKSGGGRGITLTFNVEDLEMIHALLTRRGTEPTPIRARWGAKVFYVRDPEGHRIEFWTAAPMS